MPFNSGNIRPLAVAIIQNPKGEILGIKGYDKVKNEYFYRLPGGGMEFCERAEQTLQREFREEFGIKLKNVRRAEVCENIFTYNGKSGHEIVFIMKADFEDASLYQQKELKIIEKEAVAEYAEWVKVGKETIIYPEKAKELF